MRRNTTVEVHVPIQAMATEVAKLTHIEQAAFFNVFFEELCENCNSTEIPLKDHLKLIHPSLSPVIKSWLSVGIK